MKLPLRLLAPIIFSGFMASSAALADTMTLSLSSSDFILTPQFSDIDFFTIDVEIDRPLASGLYVNPRIIDVTYQVRGTLAPGTPSGKLTVNLQRYMSGAEFYAQGSSLRFEISRNAVLIDGVQVDELVGTGAVLTFNAREINTGRYDPPQLVLNSNGTGQIQNANNIPSVEPLVTVGLGEEYITDLRFDPGNTTVITASGGPVIGPGGNSGSVCIISNLVNGTFLESQLGRLREFRDKWLLPYRFGRHFVAWYYRVSPTLTDAIVPHAILRGFALSALTLLICLANYPAAMLLLPGAMAFRMYARRRYVSN